MSEPMYGADGREVIVRCRNIHKRFGSLEVLKGVDMDLHKGEVVVIFGRSGSGKSTLLRCVNFLEDPTEGTIEACGMTLTGGHRTPLKRKQIRHLRTRIGMCFQQFNLFPHMTVLENVMVAPTMVKGEDKEVVRARAVDLLDKVGLADKAEQHPIRLSGGQQQRVAIARSLAMQPEVMLFDEPTSALDTKIGAQVMELIRNEMKARDTAAVIVTHDQRMTHYADRTVEIVDGRLGAEHAEAAG